MNTGRIVGDSPLTYVSGFALVAIRLLIVTVVSQSHV